MISIIALLMAILLPTLQRVRKQARAVVCQSNLRQWGTIWATYAAENDGRLPGWRDGPEGARWGWWGPGPGPGPGPGEPDPRWRATTKGIMRCPMATKLASPGAHGGSAGGTFLAWGVDDPEHWPCYSSYGMNVWVSWHWGWSEHRFFWRTADVTGAGNMPVYLDSCGPWVWTRETDPPPECDAVPTRVSGGYWEACCINRHNGGVNGLFLDWSARKVGLKELWTLKWHREWNTAGPWTKAGGVRPEDWPKWMRRFKDY